MTPALSLEDLIQKMIPYKERQVKLRKMGAAFWDKMNWIAYGEWYDWMINEWIHEQPDSDILMRLFIECGFNVPAFCLIVMGKPNKLIDLAELELQRKIARGESP